MFTASFFARCTRPWPRQTEHGFFKIRPAPPHVGQVVLVTTWPKNDCAARRISPEPPHPGHVWGPVPGSAPLPEQRSHAARRATSISFSTPVKDSSKVMRSEERRVGKECR